MSFELYVIRGVAITVAALVGAGVACLLYTSDAADE